MNITREAILLVRRVQAREAADTRPISGGLRWEEDVRPVLLAVYRAVAQAASPFGVEQSVINAELGRDKHDARTDRVLYELERTGYLEPTVPAIGGAWGASMVRLTEKALQETAGWPTGSGEDLAGRLFASLDELIEQAPTEEQRGKLVRVRDAALGVGRDVLTDVLSKMATGAL